MRLKNAKEFRRRKNFDLLVFFQCEQMLVTGDNKFGIGR
jgi:hypothetical protein